MNDIIASSGAHAPLNVIARRWPDVAAELGMGRPCESVSMAMTPQKTLSINGFRLASGFDRTGEAQIQALTVPKDATECWVYGIAMGDAIAQALMFDKMKTVNVVIMSRSIAKVSLEFDRHGWVNSPRIKLHLAKDLDKLNRPYIVSPVEMRLADDDARFIRDSLLMATNEEFNRFSMSTRINAEISHIEDNKEYLEKDGSISECFGDFCDRAIVIGGGPTVKDSFEWIAAQDATTVAASTALIPLSNDNQHPTYVVVADPAPIIAKHFEGCDPDLSTLVYVPSVAPAVLKSWDTDFASRKQANIYIGEGSDLYSGGSVAHACVDLAVKMGAKEVHLVGIDLCYPGGKSHVDGAACPYEVGNDQNAWRYETVNGLGERVRTDEALCQYRIKFEEYIKAHPHVRFVKHGKQGVPLKGAEWFDEP